MKVAVYKTLRKKDLYLYVMESDGLSRVPDDLLTRFGDPVVAMSFELTADRPLAREDPARVLSNLQQHGYHLQLPPAENQW